MENKRTLTYELQNIDEAAQFVIDNLADNTIILLEGEMGAGKTTLTKALCKYWEVEDNVSSPTFSIVNEYRNKSNQSIYHFDFYRLEDIEEAIQIGVEDYFYSNNICLLEWSSRVENILPDKFILLTLKVEEDNKRKLAITYE